MEKQPVTTQTVSKAPVASPIPHSDFCNPVDSIRDRQLRKQMGEKAYFEYKQAQELKAAIAAQTEKERKEWEAERRDKIAGEAGYAALRGVEQQQYLKQRLGEIRQEEAGWRLMERQRREEEEEEAAHRGMDAKIERMEEAEGAAIAAAQDAKREAAEKKRKEEELKAGLMAYYQGRKAGEVQLSDIACTPENIQKPKNWLEKAWDWAESPATGWGIATEEESVKLMQKAKGFPDVSIPLPMLKGFGMDGVAGPLKYTVKTDTAVRLFGRVLDDAAPGILTGIGLGITIAPNLVKNVREENPWNQTAADLIIDTVGFGVSEAAGWGGGALGGLFVSGTLGPEMAPAGIIIGKVIGDGLTSIGWDYLAERYQWNEMLSQRLEEGAQSFGQKATTSMQEALDTEKYPPVPTPPTAPQMTGTPVPGGQNPTITPSGAPAPANVPVMPTPSTPPAPQER